MKNYLSEWSQTSVKSFKFSESLQKWSVIRTTFQGLVCPAVVEIAVTNYDRTDDFIWTKAYTLKQIGNFFF